MKEFGVKTVHVRPSTFKILKAASYWLDEKITDLANRLVKESLERESDKILAAKKNKEENKPAI
jgi:hypothetical protein